jgi:hypothetical protein
MNMPENGGEGEPDRRWALRRSVELDADLTDTAELTYAAKVTEISEEGCTIRISSGQMLVRDRLHTIKIMGLDALSGYVIWCSDGKAGMTFSEPLHPATVSDLLMKSHYVTISRRMAGKTSSKDYLPPLPPFPFDA